MASNTTYAVQVDVIESGQVTSVEEGALYIKDSELKAVVGGSEVSVYPAASTATTTTVNISSAQILAMGSTPIELLPAAGANKYYDIDRIILEYTHVSAAYTTTSTALWINDGNFNIYPDKNLITTSSNRVWLGNWELSDIIIADEIVRGYVTAINSPVVLSTFYSDNPAAGNGTMRAIITYTTRTFGA